MDEEQPDPRKSLEDQLVEFIKDSELTDISGEEIVEITRAAVERAFFSPREEKNGWQTTTHPSMVIELARECFKEKMDEYVKSAVGEIVKKKEFQEIAAQYMVTALPQVLRESINSTSSFIMTQMNAELEKRVALQLTDLLREMKHGP